MRLLFSHLYLFWMCFRYGLLCSRSRAQRVHRMHSIGRVVKQQEQSRAAEMHHCIARQEADAAAPVRSV